jgi:hypothetical protein
MTRDIRTSSPGPSSAGTTGSGGTGHRHEVIVLGQPKHLTACFPRTPLGGIHLLASAGRCPGRSGFCCRGRPRADRMRTVDDTLGTNFSQGYTDTRTAAPQPCHRGGGQRSTRRPMALERTSPGRRLTRALDGVGVKRFLHVFSALDGGVPEHVLRLAIGLRGRSSRLWVARRRPRRPTRRFARRQPDRQIAVPGWVLHAPAELGPCAGWPG